MVCAPYSPTMPKPNMCPLYKLAIEIGCTLPDGDHVPESEDAMAVMERIRCRRVSTLKPRTLGTVKQSLALFLRDIWVIKHEVAKETSKAVNVIITSTFVKSLEDTWDAWARDRFMEPLGLSSSAPSFYCKVIEEALKHKRKIAHLTPQIFNYYSNYYRLIRDLEDWNKRDLIPGQVRTKGASPPPSTPCPCHLAAAALNRGFRGAP
jgi:hypothetical protein